MKVIFVDETEIEDLNEFICPKCQSSLVNKDYKINGYTIIWIILMGLCFWAGYLL